MIRSWTDYLDGMQDSGGYSKIATREEKARTLQAHGSIGGVILAGVHQWGGSLLDQTLPRPLLPIANRPLVTYSLDWLQRSGIADICICGNSATPLLRERLEREPIPDVRLHHYEDTMPRGPAGCIRDAWSGGGFETLVVVDGTILPQTDISEVIEAHARTSAIMTVVVEARHGPGGSINDALTPTGIYVFDRRALDCVPTTGYQDVKEGLIPRLYEQGDHITTYVSRKPAPRVTETESYLAVNDWTAERMISRPGASDGYARIGDALVHSSVPISPDVKLIGPVLVGLGTKLGEGVTLVGPTTVGTDCVLGDGAVVCRSSIWDSCSVGSGVFLDRCVLTHEAVVGPKSTVRCTVWSQTRRRSSLVVSFGSLLGPGRKRKRIPGPSRRVA